MLPTREECKTIVEKSDAFYCSETEVNGFKVEMYDYRLASYKDFKENDAFELRGLTFIQNNDTWERNILMDKFFNINQNEDWLVQDVKDKKVVRVQDKVDGSVISFVKFPDGSVRAKSKMSFESDQAKMAQKLYEESPYLSKVISEAIDQGLILIFELVSPFNQIVLEYKETKLVLLQIRDSKTGEYKTAKEMHDMTGFEIAQDYHIITGPQSIQVLDDLLQRKETEEGIEGWVVTFEDGQMAKIKTDWYLARHGLISEIRENTIIELVLNEEIDDVLSALTPASEKYKQVTDIQEIVDKKFNHLVKEYKDLRNEYFNKFNENRKEFAVAYAQKHKLFGIVIKQIGASFRDVEKVAEQGVKDLILRQTNGLIAAKEWLNEN